MKKFLKAALALVALCAPAVAFADPATIVFIATSTIEVLGIEIAVSTIFYAAVVALNVYGSAQARKKARAEARRQRAEYNANLVDRAATVLRADPPWRIVYGTAIVGGDIVAVFTSDKNTLDEEGNPRFKPDAYKHLVIHVASHKSKAIDDVLIEGIRVGDLDENGWAVSHAAGTGKDYVIASGVPVGATSITVAGGSGTILAGDDVFFPGDSTRYRVVTGITGGGQNLVIQAPGLRVPQAAGAEVMIGNEFAHKRVETRKVTIAAGASVLVPQPVREIISAGFMGNFGSEASGFVDVLVTLSSDRLTLTNTHATEQIEVTYSSEINRSFVRISKHLGDDNQTVDPYLHALFPTLWTVDHRLRGLTYVVVTLDIEHARFQSGAPQMSFDMRGCLVLDTRTSTTDYTENNALIIQHFLCAPWGFNADPSTDVNVLNFNANANVVDTPTSYLTTDANGNIVPVVGPLYTCNGSFTTDQTPETVLNDLCQSMAGFVTYGAQWECQAGAWSVPVMTLNDEDLDGQIEIVQTGAGLDTLFNAVRGTYIPRGKPSPTDYDPYQNAVFRAADGEDLITNITLPWTDSKYRAKRIVRTETERNRDGLVITYPAKLKAWKLKVGDRVYVNCDEYGFVNKPFRVTDWQFTLTTAVVLTLQEDGPGAYDDADATTADPQPNSELPSPEVVRPVKGLSAVSGTSTLLQLRDGTLVPRVKVSWNRSDDAYVQGGQGYLSLRWKDAVRGVWTPMEVRDDSTECFILGAEEGSRLIIVATWINSWGRESDVAYITHSVVGKSQPAADVTGFTAVGLETGVQSSWDFNSEIDYGFTEIRVGASWAAGTPIFRGYADSFLWTDPLLLVAEGGSANYTLRARHCDTTGNYSLGEAVQSVTFINVDSSTVATNFNNRNDRDGTTPVTPVIASDGTAIDHVINATGNVDISFEWTWSGLNADIDGFEVMVRDATNSTPYTPGTTPSAEQVFYVPAYKRVAYLFGLLPTNYYTLAVRAYRIVDPDVNSAEIVYSPWVKSTLAAENPYRPASSVAFSGNLTGTVDGTPTSGIVSAVTNFNARNDRLATSVVSPTIPGSGTAIDHTVNADGSCEISFEWLWSGAEEQIDGFQIMQYVSGSSSAYTPGSSPSSENIFTVPASKRVIGFSGMAQLYYYTFAVRAYRVVDPDISSSGLLFSPWVKSTIAGEDPYRPASSIQFLGDLSGTIDSVATSSIVAGVTNFNNRNDRLSAAIVNPTIPTDGTAVDHVSNASGGVDISFEWAWSGTETHIDGFQVMVYGSTSSSPYTVGTSSIEDVYDVPANRRAAVVYNANPTTYYTFAVRAYRVVDADISSAQVLYSSWVQPSLGSEHPYRPASSVAFSGDLSGTLQGTSTSTVVAAVTNFNSRNDRLSSAVVAPGVAGDGTAIDHVINGNGSADISFEWTWGGSEADIDGFQVMTFSSSSSVDNSPGSSPAAENIVMVPANKRAMLLHNAMPTNYFSFAVRAYRVVDPDISASGLLVSSWVMSPLGAERPYRPASNLQFLGDITGTINGTSSSTIVNAAVNFNNRNDRLGTPVLAPIIGSDGTYVDHVINADGSADISFEWYWSGTESQIDGFEVLYRVSSSGSEYTIGSAPAEEMILVHPANKRAAIFLGGNPTNYYTFAVRAYRRVDPDISASRVLYSSWVKPSLGAENPYQPSSSVAFAGNVTGTVAGIPAANVNVWSALTGVAVGTSHVVDNAMTDVLSQSVSSLSYSTPTGDPRGTLAKTLAEIVYVNPSSSPTVVEVIGTVSHGTIPVDNFGFDVQIHFSFDVYSGVGIGGTRLGGPTFSTKIKLPYNTTQEIQMTKSWQYTVAAGATVTFNFYSSALQTKPGSPPTLYGIDFKIAAVKK